MRVSLARTVFKVLPTVADEVVAGAKPPILQERHHEAMTEFSRANLQRILLEERAALATPIDFADLERRGVLTRAPGGWFVLRQPKAPPAYAWKQVTTVRSRPPAMPMVKFSEPDEDERSSRKRALIRVSSRSPEGGRSR